MRACPDIRKRRCSRRASRQVSACLALALFGVFSAFAVTIRSKSDLRLWETVADRSLPLEWPWEGAADSATVSFSNRLTRACSTMTVVRAAGATRGSCASPVTQPGGETLVDATLVQTAGRCARHVKGRVILYLQAPRVYAYDPTWLDEAGESGYDIAWPLYVGLKIILR